MELDPISWINHKVKNSNYKIQTHVAGAQFVLPKKAGRLLKSCNQFFLPHYSSCACEINIRCDQICSDFVWYRQLPTATPIISNWLAKALKRSQQNNGHAI